MRPNAFSRIAHPCQVRMRRGRNVVQGRMNKIPGILILLAAVASGCATVVPTRHDTSAATSSLTETRCRLDEAIAAMEQALVEHQRLTPSSAGRGSWWSQECRRLQLTLATLERAKVVTEKMLGQINQRAAQPSVPR